MHGRHKSCNGCPTVFGLVGTTFGTQQPGADFASLVSRVDRIQAAQLYAGKSYGVLMLRWLLDRTQHHTLLMRPQVMPSSVTS